SFHIPDRRNTTDRSQRDPQSSPHTPDLAALISQPPRPVASPPGSDGPAVGTRRSVHLPAAGIWTRRSGGRADGGAHVVGPASPLGGGTATLTSAGARIARLASKFAARGRSRCCC